VSGVRAVGAGAGLGAVTGFLGDALVTLAARAFTAVTLDRSLMMPFLATAVLGAWDGKRPAAKASPAMLQRAFGAVLPAVAVAMGAMTLP